MKTNNKTIVKTIKLTAASAVIAALVPLSAYAANSVLPDKFGGDKFKTVQKKEDVGTQKASAMNPTMSLKLLSDSPGLDKRD